MFLPVITTRSARPLATSNGFMASLTKSSSPAPSHGSTDRATGRGQTGETRWILGSPWVEMDGQGLGFCRQHDHGAQRHSVGKILASCRSRVHSTCSYACHRFGLHSDNGRPSRGRTETSWHSSGLLISGSENEHYRMDRNRRLRSFGMEPSAMAIPPCDWCGAWCLWRVGRV
jgi:hypothetical protein